jgi:thioredoxin 1
MTLMPTFRRLLSAVAFLALATPAFAATPIPFDEARFAAAQAADKPILVQIHADWCPTCAAQKPILGALEATPEFADLVVLNVDFDSQKDVVRKFAAQMQSTLIVYRGKDEKARSVGETDPAKIKALLERSRAR